MCDIISNLSIVNGRNSTADDYTFESTRGCSVVDYCLTAYETLSRTSNFKVIRASQLVQDTNILGQADFSYALPDHSCLNWSFMLDCKSKASIPTSTGCERIKYKVSSIPQSFMLSDNLKDEVFSTIASLEPIFKVWGDINHAYDQFCSTVKKSMNTDLQKRVIKN